MPTYPAVDPVGCGGEPARRNKDTRRRTFLNHRSVSARRPASVILTRATSIRRPPPTIRSGCPTASPARQGHSRRRRPCRSGLHLRRGSEARRLSHHPRCPHVARGDPDRRPGIDPLRGAAVHFYIFAALLGCRDRRTAWLGRVAANAHHTAGAPDEEA